VTRRVPSRLTPAEVAEVVRRREAGELWKSIGRDMRRQDGFLKRVYERALAQTSNDTLAVAA
jgi:hypothetical protein